MDISASWEEVLAINSLKKISIFEDAKLQTLFRPDASAASSLDFYIRQDKFKIGKISFLHSQWKKKKKNISQTFNTHRDHRFSFSNWIILKNTSRMKRFLWRYVILTNNEAYYKTPEEPFNEEFCKKALPRTF